MDCIKLDCRVAVKMMAILRNSGFSVARDDAVKAIPHSIVLHTARSKKLYRYSS